MAKRVRIITFIDDREGREDGEAVLTDLVNQGYEIKAAGGGNAAGLLWGFVILEIDNDSEYGEE